MNCRRISTAILVQILPEHRIPRHRPECCSVLPRLVAVHKLAPALIVWRVQYRKVRASSSEIAGCNVYKERGQSVSAHFGCYLRWRFEPIRMEMVVFPISVLYKLQWL